MRINPNIVYPVGSLSFRRMETNMFKWEILSERPEDGVLPEGTKVITNNIPKGRIARELTEFLANVTPGTTAEVV